MRRVVASLVVVLVAGCGVFSSDPSSGGESPPPDGKTPEENAKPPVVPVGGPAPPGIYVSSSMGAADGSGSDGRPLKTLAAAFAQARADRLPVIACAEEFAESLTLLDGVSAYGYFDCKSGWKRTALHAVVRSPTSPGAVARDLALPTRIEGFDIYAPDVDGAPATAEASTSIGLEVRNGKKLLIAESSIHAGRGANGVDGVQAPSNGHVASAMGASGVAQGPGACNPNLSNCDTRKVIGPAGPSGACVIGVGGSGGAGGDGTWYSRPSNVFSNPTTWRGKPLAAGPATGLGGAPGLGAPNGSPGATGNDGANGTWTIARAGYAIGSGLAGAAGGPGQGGGGGGGAQYINGMPSTPAGFDDYFRSATGGSGGAGGCPGQPSKPGTGGGASIAMLVVDSDVTITASRLESSNGGRAGRGFFGGIGTVGGGGGAAVTFSGKGGDGGTGGSAGFSGHGAPGPSIALVYAGAKPALDRVALTPGPAGAGYPEEQRTDGARVVTLPAVTGASLAEYVIP